MDELPVAQIDAYMADAAAAGGKEHQVTGGAFLRGDAAAHIILAGGAVGKADAKGTKDLHGEAGAVDAAVAGTAVAVGGA